MGCKTYANQALILPPEPYLYSETFLIVCIHLLLLTIFFFSLLTLSCYLNFFISVNLKRFYIY